MALAWWCTWCWARLSVRWPARAPGEAGVPPEPEHLRTVLNVLPTAVLITGPDGRLLATNQASQTIWAGEVPLGTDITEFPTERLRWVRTGQPVAREEWSLDR